MLNFAVQHPGEQPQMLVQVSAEWKNKTMLNSQMLTNLHCPLYLVYGENNELFPVFNARQLYSMLRSNNVPVVLSIIPGLPNDLEPERGVIFRSIGELCLTHLMGKGISQNYHSISRWRADAPSLALFFVPAIAWGVGWFAWLKHRTPARPKKSKPKIYEILFRLLAVLLATLASVEATLHMVSPHFSVNDTTLSIARLFLVQARDRQDFDFLAENSIWHNAKPKSCWTMLNWPVITENWSIGSLMTKCL